MGNDVYNFSGPEIEDFTISDETSGDSGMGDKFSILFENLFNSEIDIVDRNTIVFLQIKNWIEKNEMKEILGFLETMDSFYTDLHPSLIKSALLISSEIEEAVTISKSLDNKLSLRLQ
jgi:hypothetical protein